MFFFTLNNIEIDFIYRHIYWKTYIIAKVLLTMSLVELIWKKKFATTALDLEDKAFVFDVAFIN